MLRPLDIWNCAIVKQRAANLGQADLVSENLAWLPRPEAQFTFRADPFGLWDEGKLHVFVEYFDYRDLKGRIELLIYDEGLNLLSAEIVLNRPWHLSYPFVFRSAGEVWMLPEARRSGELTLYRAAAFPRAWKPFTSIGLAGHGVDATLLFHQEFWWLFYASIKRGREPISELHIAFSNSLEGPWKSHPLNPVRSGFECTRPGGTPIVREDGAIDLPMQDGSKTYGGAVRRLRIHLLTARQFEAEDSLWLEPARDLDPFLDGIHTISAAGEVCLIDCKFVNRSMRGTLAWRRGKISEARRELKLARGQGG